MGAGEIAAASVGEDRILSGGTRAGEETERRNATELAYYPTRTGDKTGNMKLR